LFKKITLFFILLAYPSLASAQTSAAVQLEITRAVLVSGSTGIAPGQPLELGVLLRPKEHWHSYWENPGDAGLATTLAWTLPEGFSASSIDWPPPRRFMEGPLAIYGYDGDVLLPVTITPPASLDASAGYPIRVKAEWLICKDICIPESAELELTLPVTPAPEASEYAYMFEEHQARRPAALKTPVRYADKGEALELTVPLASLDLSEINDAYFFPRQSNLVRYAEDQPFMIENGQMKLVIKKSGSVPEGTLSGILSVSGGDAQKYFDITLASVAPPLSAAPQAADVSLPLILLFAVLGGLILNLMPCVLPVLSLKALAVVKKVGHERYHVARQGMAYTLGILASFAVIAATLIGLQQGGEAVGWGYQMQSPAFVGFLIYLLFLVGLSLSGVFHLPVLLGHVGSREIADESSLKGSFFTGVLATAVATPCTAPFMASALGVALTLPPLQAMLVFEALGFGLALPFLLISLFPACLRFLPKPGAWMNTFKELLAFPMYASAVWLLWVLTLQTGAGGMAVAMVGMLAIVAVIWMRSLFKESTRYRIFALIAMALVLALTLPALSRMEGAGMMPQTQEVNTVSYSPQKLSELRASGTPVFVDATAAWCITCQLNARVALHTDRTMQAFRERGVTLMVADWTRRNAEISEFLAGFHYQGVPLYVFYPAGGEPVVLPQLLTESMVIEAIGGR
jgi:thiol:disulfide interchange protein